MRSVAYCVRYGVASKALDAVQLGTWEGVEGKVLSDLSWRVTNSLTGFDALALQVNGPLIFTYFTDVVGNPFRRGS